MASNCAKCNGLIIQDYCLVTTAWFSKCIQCGARPDIPRRDPEPHHLSKPKGYLTTCRCGQPKREWRSLCAECGLKKLHSEQRRSREEKRSKKRVLSTIREEMQA